MKPETKVRLVSVSDRLPDGYIVPLLYVYRNGNEGWAMGYYNDKEREWKIEYSEDHPTSSDIKFWIEMDGL